MVAAALEAGTVKSTDIIATSPGWMRLGGRQVRDPANYGDMSLARILAKSSNVGISKLALSIPVQQLLGTYQSMGLGSFRELTSRVKALA